ncbi:MAG: type II toxin-antitoxin system VapC family toxin [Pirellulales bacterium]
MDRSLLDTSTLSDVIAPTAKRRPAVTDHLQRYLAEHGRLTFSQISCYEILRGLRKKRAAAQIERFATFCKHSELVPVAYDVLDRAAQLWADGRQRGITVDDSDLVIAATALLEGLPLVTANARHFAWIDGLTISNWRES